MDFKNAKDLDKEDEDKHDGDQKVYLTFAKIQQYYIAKKRKETAEITFQVCAHH